MPEFKNILTVDVQMDVPNGPGFLVKPNDIFEGSDYYLKYTVEGGASGDLLQLELVSGDTTNYATPYNVDSYDGVNKFKSYNVTLTGSFDDNILNLKGDLGKEATYLLINGASTMRINGDSDSDFAITDTFEFPTNRISVATLALSGSGAITVFAGTSIK